VLLAGRRASGSSSAASRRLVDDAQDDAFAVLAAHRSELDALADALLEHVTLDADQAALAIGLPSASTSAGAAALTRCGGCALGGERHVLGASAASAP
jgi:hypothetical protein